MEKINNYSFLLSKSFIFTSMHIGLYICMYICMHVWFCMRKCRVCEGAYEGRGRDQMPGARGAGPCELPGMVVGD